jgi:two-component system cell cycle response regulator
MKQLQKLIVENEDWLMSRILQYARDHGYVRYTSTLWEAWRLSIAGLSRSILILLQDDHRDLELTSDTSFSEDPAAGFGVLEARRHRKRGISLSMFIGLMKYYRESYLDLIREQGDPAGDRSKHLKFIQRFFDRMEIGFCSEWAGLAEDEKLSELQATNRSMTNEKNKYLTIFESLSTPVILIDETLHVENMNQAATALLQDPRPPGAEYYRLQHPVPETNAIEEKRPVAVLFPWLMADLKKFAESEEKEGRLEIHGRIGEKEKFFFVCFSRMLDVSLKFSGTLVIVEDISERRLTENRLQRATADLQRNVSALKKANRKIVDHQRTLIEEERLKVLLQMAGATAHEINQPLTTLLGSIQLLEMDQSDPEKLQRYLRQIQDAGYRIAKIVRKIQTIRHDDIKPYAGKISIVNLDQTIAVLSIEPDDDDYRKMAGLLSGFENITHLRAHSLDNALEKVGTQPVDLVFLSDRLPSGSGADLMMRMAKTGLDIPVVMMTGPGNEVIASNGIQAGACDYLEKSDISDRALSRVITRNLEKIRLKKEIKLIKDQMLELTARDDLTGLYNHRHFLEILEIKVAEARRYQTNLVLALLEVGRMEKIDAGGSGTCEPALRDIADLLRDTIRKSDVPCRLEGDKLAVLMPNTRLHDAESLYCRLQHALNRQAYSDASDSGPLTIGIGLACYDVSVDGSHMDFLERALTSLDMPRPEGNGVELSKPAGKPASAATPPGLTEDPAAADG